MWSIIQSWHLWSTYFGLKTYKHGHIYTGCWEKVSFCPLKGLPVFNLIPCVSKVTSKTLVFDFKTVWSNLFWWFKKDIHDLLHLYFYLLNWSKRYFIIWDCHITLSWIWINFLNHENLVKKNYEQEWNTEGKTYVTLHICLISFLNFLAPNFSW